MASNESAPLTTGVKAFLLTNIVITGFCVLSNAFLLLKQRKQRDFYILVTLSFLLATNMSKAPFRTLLVRLALITSEYRQNQAEFSDWKRYLYFDIPFYCFFIVQLSILFQL